MKRAILSAILAVGLLVSMVVPAVAAEPALKVDLPLQADLHSAEFAFDFDPEPVNTPVLEPFWVDMVNAEYFPDGGDGIYVAVLDTGLSENWPAFFPHAQIATEWGIGFSHDVEWCYDTNRIVWGPLRDDRGFLSGLSSGHGTHVASTIVGYSFAGHIMQGVAPKATIIPVLCLDGWIVEVPEWVDERGFVTITGGSWEMVSAAVYYIADLAEDEGIEIIINMSLGAPAPNPMMEDAINYALERDVIIVASAGNDGYAGMGWPGAYPQVISAAAGGWTEQWLAGPAPWWFVNDVPEKLNTEDYWGNNWQTYLTWFSSRPNTDLGQKAYHLDVTTPGAWIVGPYRPYFAGPAGDGYYYLSGTSMAAPHVAGIAAIVLEEYPHLSPSQMQFILRNAAQGLPLPADGAYALDPAGLWFEEWYGDDYGAGWLTADRAMSRADVFDRGRFRP